METTAIKNVRIEKTDLTSQFILNNHQRINYFESDGIYTYSVLDDGSRIRIDKFLHHLEDTLSKKLYYRCGWSFIVNLSKIQEYWLLEYPFLVMENGEVIPVPLSEKDNLKELVAGRLVIRQE